MSNVVDINRSRLIHCDVVQTTGALLANKTEVSQDGC